MASSDDWKAALTASERFKNIQNIEKAAREAVLAASAITLENEAYLSSSTRADYDAACAILSQPPLDAAGEGAHSAFSEPMPESVSDDDVHGLRIGPYSGCRYVARGVTAEVYRSGNRALKVITETKNMQPHDHLREAQILRRLANASAPCIRLLETFYDADQCFVLVFPYLPLSMADVHGHVPRCRLLRWFADLFAALAYLHAEGILHRDVKPSAVLLTAPDGAAVLSDFGTAWHPGLSPPVEPADNKALDVGTGPYRAPEALFGDRSYGPPVDLWAAGAILAEYARPPPPPPAATEAGVRLEPQPRPPLFASRPAHEDGSQLGLILSIFKTIGTPNNETWPQAVSFKTPPTEMYRVFPPQPWDGILPDVDADVRTLVAQLVRYDRSQVTAGQALAAVQVMLENDKEP